MNIRTKAIHYALSHEISYLLRQMP